MDLVVFFQHLAGKDHIPTVFFQNFPHEAVQVADLDIKAEMSKVGGGCSISSEKNVVLVVLSMADAALFQCFFPKGSIVRLLQKIQRLFPFFQKPLDASLEFLFE